MSLKIESFYPLKVILRSWVETYRLIEADDEVRGETVANARVDAVITLQGKVSIFDSERNEFIALPKCCFFPFTRQGATKVLLDAGTKLINIKFYPHVLSASCFQNLSFQGAVDFEGVFGKTSSEYFFAAFDSKRTIEPMRVVLDNFLETHLLDSYSDNPLLNDTISFIEEGATQTFAIENLAKKAGVSFKTLERNFKNHTGLTIKMYHDLVRFQKTAQQINANGTYHHGDLLEALGSGYYDQSHFVKACRKLTGLSPKQLFTRLPGEITDFVVF